MQNAINIILLLVLASGAMALLLDARQRRLERRVAVVIKEADAAAMLSLRRQQQSENWRIARTLFKYDRGIVYDVSPIYVFGVGIIVILAVCYANTYLHFPFVDALLAGFAAAGIAIRSLFGWQQHRFTDRLFRQLPDVIQLVTSTVRAGLPVAAAFGIIAKEMPEPTKRQFAIVCDELNLGGSAEDAIEGVARRTHVAEYGMFAMTLAIQSKAGGSMAETLQTLGDTVRQRVGLAGRARALAGEVIFSARALSLAPFVVGGMLYLISHESLDMLFTDPTGRMLLAYAGTSVLFGTLVIRWMVQKGTAL